MSFERKRNKIPFATLTLCSLQQRAHARLRAFKSL